jgi:hypothetical protein
MRVHSLVKVLFFGSLAAIAVAWWFKDLPPPPERLNVDVLEPPVQKAVRKPPFDVSVNGGTYRIQPRYSYDLNAVVVSLHHSDSWWDHAHREWGDFINVMDLCVAWGEGVRSGTYRRVSFSNSQWECHFSFSSMEAATGFHANEVSNNHIVTDDPAVARALKNVRVGDQIRLQGYLIDYATLKDGRVAGTRVSSDNREDTGPGACEVLYIESLDKLKSANRNWRIALYAALAGLLLSVIAWFALPMDL